LRRWQVDSVFREFFTVLLADAPYSAFRWEAPPIMAASAAQPFEFVILDSPELESQHAPDAFAEPFGRFVGSEDVISFPNLNNDAILVPCPLGPLSAYGHLGAFVRDAPDAQKHSLWKLVGELMERRLDQDPFGSVRREPACHGSMRGSIKDRKYYGHAQYRECSRPARIQLHIGN
jgi:hypothetical protein